MMPSMAASDRFRILTRYSTTVPRVHDQMFFTLLQASLGMICADQPDYIIFGNAPVIPVNTN